MVRRKATNIQKGFEIKDMDDSLLVHLLYGHFVRDFFNRNVGPLTEEKQAEMWDNCEKQVRMWKVGITGVNLHDMTLTVLSQVEIPVPEPKKSRMRSYTIEEYEDASCPWWLHTVKNQCMGTFMSVHQATEGKVCDTGCIWFANGECLGYRNLIIGNRWGW